MQNLPQRHGKAGDGRRNSFDVIRLAAALAVAFGHQMEFAGRPEPVLGPLRISMSNIGLFVFFALSGYLIFKSLERRPRWSQFAAGRLLRIYPGVIVNTVLCVVLGSTVTSMAAALYWSDPSTWSYLTHGIAIIVPPTQTVLPGVFTAARWPDVNTPIWTLKYELMLYAVLFAFYRLVAPRCPIHLALLVLVTGLAVALIAAFALAPLPAAEDFYARYNVFNSLRFGTIFAAGAFLASIEDRTPDWRLAPLFACIAVLVLSPFDAVARVALILIFVVLVVEIGRSPLLFSRTYRSVGDLSFGIYLYAYPIGQAMMLWLGPRLPFYQETAIAFSCAILMSVASWYAVERPTQTLRRLF